jgi:trk system potassium uptake protein TrkH
LLRNTEAQAFVGVLLASIALISVYLVAGGAYPSYLEALRHTAFHVVSVATTTGYASYDYAQWPVFAPLLMILLGCFATCAGSTGGGIKMVRMLLLVKQSRRELVRIVHPNAVTPVVLGGAAVSDRVMRSVIAYMMMYGATLVGLTMLLLFSGLDVVTAFTAVRPASTTRGQGLVRWARPATTRVSATSRPGSARQPCCSAGWIATVLVLFTPSFWRKCLTSATQGACRFVSMLLMLPAFPCR